MPDHSDDSDTRPTAARAPSTLRGACFPTTQWSRVLCAANGSAGDAPLALDGLCRVYWPPLYAYARRDGLRPLDAQDAVQEFIALLLKRDDLSGVHPEKGRFRSFLLAAFKHFLVSRIRGEKAQKRGGNRTLLALDTTDAETLCAAELTGEATPDRAFDRGWARTVMSRALERLRLEHREPSQKRLFTALLPVLTEGARLENQAALASQLGVTAGALAVAASRLRRRYRALIEDEIAQTLAPEASFAEELAALREAWR